MAREDTGELLIERRLDHESGEARAFYCSLHFKGAAFWDRLFYPFSFRLADTSPATHSILRLYFSLDR